MSKIVIFFILKRNETTTKNILWSAWFWHKIIMKFYQFNMVVVLLQTHFMYTRKFKSLALYEYKQSVRWEIRKISTEWHTRGKRVRARERGDWMLQVTMYVTLVLWACATPFDLEMLLLFSFFSHLFLLHLQVFWHTMECFSSLFIYLHFSHR